MLVNRSGSGSCRRALLLGAARRFVKKFALCSDEPPALGRTTHTTPARVIHRVRGNTRIRNTRNSRVREMSSENTTSSDRSRRGETGERWLDNPSFEKEAAAAGGMGDSRDSATPPRSPSESIAQKAASRLDALKASAAIDGDVRNTDYYGDDASGGGGGGGNTTPPVVTTPTDTPSKVEQPRTDVSMFSPGTAHVVQTARKELKSAAAALAEAKAEIFAAPTPSPTVLPPSFTSDREDEGDEEDGGGRCGASSTPA